MNLAFQAKNIQTPRLIGTQLIDALSQSSEQEINLRIIGKKDDPDLPNGTIISQTPKAGQKIRPHQSVFCVISMREEQRTAPHAIGKNRKQISQELKTAHLKQKAYAITQSTPCKTCIAQFPAPGEILPGSTLITYFSKDATKPFIVPSFKGLTVPEVEERLISHGITPSISHHMYVPHTHTCNQCQVIDQRPLPGSLVNLNPSLHVQLYVR